MLNRRSFLATVSVASLFGSSASARFPRNSSESDTKWRRLKIGGGGFVMGMSMSADGSTKVIYTDAGGASILDNSSGLWEQLITSARMPDNGDFDVGNRQGGCYSIAVAPSDSSRIYMFCAAVSSSGYVPGYVYVSNDSGVTFTRTSFRGVYYIDPNTQYRTCGPKMAVDPANKDIAYLSSHGSVSASISNAYRAAVTMINNYVPGQVISFSNITGTGITPGTLYYVLSTGRTSSSFQFSATPGGPAVNLSSSARPLSAIVHTQESYVTIDGFATSAVVPNLPRGGQNGPDVGIVFDPSSSVSGGRTQGTYIFSQGNGLYHSRDGGTSFSAVAGGPTFAMKGKIALDGVYYVTNDGITLGAHTAGMFRYSGSWKTITPSGATPDSVAVSTFATDVAKVYCVNNGGSIYVSTSRGDTWSSTKKAARVATDVPWLANCNESFMSVGDITMDTVVRDKLWFSEGIGVWYSTSQSGSTVTWTSQSAGIEELVINQIISPPGGVPVIACWDRPVFRITNPDVYQSHHGPDESVNINVASSIDWTTATPSTLAVMCDRFNGDYSGLSNDGGASWTKFSGGAGGSWPYGGYLSGCIAASSPSKIIRVQANDGDVYYTTDGGAKWTKASAAIWGNGAINSPGYTGWHHADFLWRQSVCADRVAPDTFYIFNSQDAARGGGIYKITFPSGVFSPVRQNTSFVAPTPNAFNLIMTAVPGYAGHVFFTTGEGQSGTTGLQRSTDGCANFKQVSKVGETYCFGFGAIKVGKDYPSVYLVGYVGGKYGIYRADADASEWDANKVTWVNIGTFPLNCLSLIKTMSGDANVWGRCYVGTATGGCFYYNS
jgi:hypothetical protein